MSLDVRLESEFDRKGWLMTGEKSYRRVIAKTNPLAWVLEYQPLIRLEGKGDFAFEPYWSQQNWLLDDSQFRLMNKTRQSGYTTSAGAGEIPMKMIHGTNETIVVISKSETEALNIMEKFYLAYDSVKDKDPDWSPYVKANTAYCRLKNGNKLKVLTSGKGSGRSFTCTHLYIDEAAYVMYMKQIFEGSFPTISRSGGRMTIFSTPESGTKFEEMCENHADIGFSYHQYEWWFVPEYNPYYPEFLAAFLSGDKNKAEHWINEARKGSWYRKTFAALGETAFMREYECSFEAGSGKAFTPKQLRSVFVPNYLEIDEDGYGELWRMPAGDWRKEYSEFVVVTDYGRKRDPTVIGVFGFHSASGKWKMVQYQRIRPSIFVWSEVVGEIMKAYEEFGQPDMWHDGTGAGDALTLELAGYSTAIMISDVVGSRVKTNALVNMTRAFDNEAIVLPKIEQLYKEFKGYKWKDTNIVQDSVMVVMMFLMKQYTADDSFVGVDKNFSFVGA